MTRDWGITGETVVVFDPLFVREWMPVLEKGVKSKEERAFLLAGDKKEGSLEIKNSKLVPESNCSARKFEPFSQETEEEFAGSEDILGYLHLHRVRKNSLTTVSSWLSPGDYHQMIEREEPVRGVALLPEEESIEKSPFNGLIIFYGSHYPRPLYVCIEGVTFSHSCCYLRKEKGLWKICRVEAFEY